MTHSNRLARFSILFAAAMALTLAAPVRSAIACGGYGKISEETRATWAVSAHMNAVKRGDMKLLKAQWPDEDKKTLKSWVAALPDKATWKVLSVEVLEGRAAVVKVEVTAGKDKTVETFTLAKRDGVWSHVMRDVSPSSRIAKRD